MYLNIGRIVENIEKNPERQLRNLYSYNEALSHVNMCVKECGTIKIRAAKEDNVCSKAMFLMNCLLEMFINNFTEGAKPDDLLRFLEANVEPCGENIVIININYESRAGLVKYLMSSMSSCVKIVFTRAAEEKRKRYAKECFDSDDELLGFLNSNNISKERIVSIYANAGKVVLIYSL